MITEDDLTTVHTRYIEAPEAPTTIGDTDAPRIVVEVIGSAYASRTFQLAYGTYRVGTRDTCDIVIADPTVSREHLDVVVRAHGVRVIDLGSTNGSYYNGEELHDLMVLPGSSIAVGSSWLRFGLVVPPRSSYVTSPRAQTQPGFAVTPNVASNPRPRFATGSIPPQLDWARPQTPASDFALLAQQPASLDVSQHAIVRPLLARPRSRKLVRWSVRMAVASVLVAGAIIAQPVLLDPLCDDYEWFGAAATDVVRQHARDVRFAIAELVAAI